MMNEKERNIIKGLYGKDYLIDSDEDNFEIGEIYEDNEGYIVNVSCIKTSEYYIPKKDVKKEIIRENL